MRPQPSWDVITAALELFGDQKRWKELQRRAMAQDFSWKRSAERYREVYQKVLS